MSRECEHDRSIGWSPPQKSGERLPDALRIEISPHLYAKAFASQLLLQGLVARCN